MGYTTSKQSGEEELRRRQLARVAGLHDAARRLRKFAVGHFALTATITGRHRVIGADADDPKP